MSDQSVSKRRWRAWAGPALLAIAPLQYLAGASILQNHPARPLTVLALAGLALAFTASLTLIAGLGETSNLLIAMLRRPGE